LFFSGAGTASLSSCPPAAPLKNKKKDDGSRFSYRQATPDGVAEAKPAMGREEAQQESV